MDKISGQCWPEYHTPEGGDWYNNVWQLGKLTSQWMCAERDVFSEGGTPITTSDVPKLGKNEKQEVKLPFQEKS